MREGKPALNTKSEKYRESLIQTGPSNKPGSERVVFAASMRTGIKSPTGAVPSQVAAAVAAGASATIAEAAASLAIGVSAAFFSQPTREANRPSIRLEINKC